MDKPLIAPSVLAADFAKIGKEIEMLNSSEADYIHVDIMDGVFVPNISFGLPVMEAIGRHAKKPLDVHLMIVRPENYVEAFARAGAGMISVHLEACPHLHRNIEQLKSLKVGAGVAINPHSNVSLLEEVLPDLDFICVMSVNPGFGGQSFIEATYQKISKLKDLIEKTGSRAKIEIDGGVTDKNALQLMRAGADILVAGSFVFKSKDPVGTIKNLKNVV